MVRADSALRPATATAAAAAPAGEAEAAARGYPGRRPDAVRLSVETRDPPALAAAYYRLPAPRHPHAPLFTIRLTHYRTSLVKFNYSYSQYIFGRRINSKNII